MADEVPSDLMSRRGKFEMALPVILEVPDTVLKVLAGVLILRCECNFNDHVFEYGGVSAQFELVEDGEVAPHYDVEWNEETETATWTKAA